MNIAIPDSEKIGSKNRIANTENGDVKSPYDVPFLENRNPGTDNFQPKNFFAEAVWLISILAVYYLSGKFGLKLAFENESASPVWAPTGIALAAFILRGYRVWPAILAGAFLVNITTTGDILTSVCIAIGNTLEGIIGAYIVCRYAGGKYAFNTARNTLKFFFLAGMLGTLISVSIGVTSLVLRGLAVWSNYFSIWLTWWLGDAVGACLVAPLIILWAVNPKVKFNKIRFLEGLCVFLTIVLIGVIEFTPYSVVATNHYPFTYLIIPPFIWLAFRFSQRFVSLAAFAMCGVAIWGTLNNYGPFVMDSPNNSLLLLQTFIALITVMSISFAAVVSERNRSAGKIKNSERELRDFVENASLGLHWVGPDGRILWANKHEMELLGYPPEEYFGHHISEFHTNRDAINDILNRLSGNETLHNYEAQLRCKDGSVRDVLISSNVYRENGKFVHTRCFTRDITDKKRAEYELRAHEEALLEAEKRSVQELHSLLEKMPAGAYTCDSTGLITYYNEKAFQLWGRKPGLNDPVDRFCGSFKLYINGEPIKHDECWMAKALLYNKEFNGEEIIVERPNGELRTALAHANPLHDEQGRVTGAVNVLIDITDRKELDNALRESEQKFHAIFKQASVGIAQFDLNGRFVLVNEQYCDILGRAQKDILGMHLEDITHPDDISHTLNLFNKLISDGEDYIIEKRYIKPDNTVVWIKKSVSLIRDNAGKPLFVAAICSDVTNQKIAERRLNIQYSVSNSLAEAVTFKEASEKVIQSICEGLDWDLGVIWLVDNKSEVLRFESSWSKDGTGDTSGMTDPGRTFKKGIGLPGRVWKRNIPLWISDVIKDNNFPRAPFAAKIGLHAGFAFPVRNGDEVIAVVECFNRKVLEPKDDLLEVLSASGSQVGNFLARKRAEEEWKIAQHTYQSLFESTLDGILIVDDKGKYVNVNESYARMLKGTREQLIGQDFSRFIPPDRLQDAISRFSTLKNDVHSERSEFPLMALDGSLVEAEWISRSNFLPGLHFCVARDITGRKNSERKLESEYKFRKAIENSLASGIAAVSLDGTQTYVNPSLCNMLGWNEEELTGAKPPFVYWPPEEIENINNAFTKTLNGTAPKDGFELRFCRKDGTRIDVLLMVTPISGEKDSGWLASVTDITELKRIQSDLRETQDKLEERVRERTRELNTLVEDMEREILERRRAEEKLKLTYEKLKETQNELIHSEKLASLGRFSSGIAHEIRNPLANISALAQLLSAKKLDPDHKKLLKYIQVNTNIANRIIKDLLSYASPHNVDFVKTDVGSMINGLYEMVNTRCLKNNVQLSKKISPELPSLMLNEQKLQTAFLNFVSNALDAMPGGGKLKIEAYADKAEKKVVIFFEDTGSGISSENLDKIMEPFFTTKDDGTGLGMSLAYQVIRAHSGEVDITSEIGKGTRITVKLPVNAAN